MMMIIIVRITYVPAFEIKTIYVDFFKAVIQQDLDVYAGYLRLGFLFTKGICGSTKQEILQSHFFSSTKTKLIKFCPPQTSVKLQW